MIIDIEKLRAIPELLKTKSRKEIAKDFGVAVSTINYWVKQLRGKGIVIENRKNEKLIDKYNV